MDIHAQLLRRPTPESLQRMVAFIGDDPIRFARLMEAFTINDWRPAQRAVWVVMKIAEVRPYLLSPHLDALFDAMEHPVHPAVLRNGLKIIADTDIALTEEQEGRVVNYAFDLLADPTQAVAIRVHAMQCIANLLPTYPDLAGELKTLIEEGMEHGSPGFRSRGRKILNQLARKR